jgi:hypothetical protein
MFLLKTIDDTTTVMFQEPLWNSPVQWTAILRRYQTERDSPVPQSDCVQPEPVSPGRVHEVDAVRQGPRLRRRRHRDGVHGREDGHVADALHQLEAGGWWRRSVEARN